MSRLKQILGTSTLGIAAVATLAMPVSAQNSTRYPLWDIPLLDNCEQSDNTSTIGTEWQPILDDDRGGTSNLTWESTNGTFSVQGVIEPVPSSMGPGTAGMMLPLGDEGEVFDINSWDGIEITVRNVGAPLLLRIHGMEIQNGDHFAGMIKESSKFVTYKFSFQELGQVMSAQQPWSGRSVTAVELVTFGWSTLPFSWEIQEMRFYVN